MAYEDNNNRGGFQREMVQGSWTCSKCGAEIKELPFQPDPSRLGQLLCRDCHRERQQNFRGGSGRRFGGNSDYRRDDYRRAA